MSKIMKGRRPKYYDRPGRKVPQMASTPDLKGMADARDQLAEAGR